MKRTLITTALLGIILGSGLCPTSDNLRAGEPRKYKIPDNLPKCPICGKFHSPTMPHCPRCGHHHPVGWVFCRQCKRCHTKGLPCPNCPPEGFFKCPKCGSFYPKRDKCPVCSMKKVPLRSATCPVCNKAFSGPIPWGINAKAGIDADFCRHSIGRKVVESMVWTCPRCGHSHWAPEMHGQKELPGKFNDKVSPTYVLKIKRQLRAEISEELVRFIKRSSLSDKYSGMTAEISQQEMPDWLKYIMAIKCARFRGDPPSVIAKLALEGSYACRRELVSAVNLPNLSRMIPFVEHNLFKYGATESDPKSVVKSISTWMLASSKTKDRRMKLIPPELFYLHIRAAGCWDRLGYPERAAESLTEASEMLSREKSPPSTLEPFLNMVAYRRRCLKIEGELRKIAITNMRKALVDKLDYPQGAVPLTIYLLGELYRRAGQYDKARPWLLLTTKLFDKEHPVCSLVVSAMTDQRIHKAASNASEEADAVAFIIKLTGKDPGDVLKKPLPVNPKTVMPLGKAPKTTREALTSIYKAFAAYVQKNGKAPAKLEDLIKENFIPVLSAGRFACPKCGAPFRYRRPKGVPKPGELLIWHPHANNCPQLMLRAGGKIEENK